MSHASLLAEVFGQNLKVVLFLKQMVFCTFAFL